MADLKHILRTVCLDGGSVSDPSPNAFFDGEQGAHTFIIAAVRGGEPLMLSGSVTGMFLNPNEATVPLTGSIVDGAAVLTLSNDCYALTGRFTLTIDVNGATVYECQSRIRRRSSTTAYDPDDEISITELVTEIQEMREVTADAAAAAADATAAATRIENYNPISGVAVGLDPVPHINEYFISRNLLDPLRVHYGYTKISGVVAQNSSYNYIDFIPVLPGCWLYGATTRGDRNAPQMTDSYIRSIDLYNRSGVLLKNVQGTAKVKNDYDDIVYASVTFQANVYYLNPSWTVMLYNVYQESDSDSSASYIIGPGRLYDPPINPGELGRIIITNKMLVYGYYTGTGKFVYSANRLALQFKPECKVPVKKGSLIRILHPKIIAAFTFFDQSGEYAATVGYYGEGWPVDKKVSSVYSPIDGYVAIHLYFNGEQSSAIDLTKYDEYEEFFAIYNAMPGPRYTISKHEHHLISGQIGGQGGCMIGDYLYSFENGTVYILDAANDFESVGSKTHDLGHANSVTYCEKTDTLLTYGATGNDQPTLVLYKNPAAASALMKADANCMEIPLYNASGHMNSSASCCFGEDEKTVYYIDGVFTNAADTNVNFNTTINIHKILLGMGDNDLSASGYGTYISGKTETEYNGTCKVVDVYVGQIVSGLNAVSNGNSLFTPQDCQYYKGRLYLAWGTSGNNILVISFNDGAGTYAVEETVYSPVTDYTGTIIPCEPEMVTIYKDNILYGATGNATHQKYFMEIQVSASSINGYYYLAPGVPQGPTGSIQITNNDAQAISTGTVTAVDTTSESGAVKNVVIPYTGWYTVIVGTGNTAGDSLARIRVGNNPLSAIRASIGQYDTFMPPPILLKKGITINWTAVIPANGSAGLYRIT